MPTTLFDVLHALIDGSAIHDPATSAKLHAAVTGQQAGFDSAEAYEESKEQEAKAVTQATVTDADLDAQLATLQAQKDARAKTSAPAAPAPAATASPFTT